jgi:hypothetical protein
MIANFICAPLAHVPIVIAALALCEQRQSTRWRADLLDGSEPAKIATVPVNAPQSRDQEKA